ncbi:hypothetical protein EON68_04720 [archaeon]|nr:MAG: hypothetical protein EON68_04720 [archaeon]
MRQYDVSLSAAADDATSDVNGDLLPARGGATLGMPRLSQADVEFLRDQLAQGCVRLEGLTPPQHAELARVCACFARMYGTSASEIAALDEPARHFYLHHLLLAGADTTEETAGGATSAPLLPGSPVAIQGGSGDGGGALPLTAVFAVAHSESQEALLKLLLADTVRPRTRTHPPPRTPLAPNTAHTSLSLRRCAHERRV